MKIRASIGGQLRVEISGGKRGTIKTGWMDNLVLDQGIVRALTSGGGNANGPVLANVLTTGASSQPPSPTDTCCINPLKTLASTGNYQEHGWDSVLGCGYSVVRYTSSRGEVVGNISEMAVGYATNNTSAVCRALIRDSQGEPTTITVLGDEVLTVFWKFNKWYTQPEDFEFTYLKDGADLTTNVTYNKSLSSSFPNSGWASGGGFTTLTGPNTAQWCDTRTESQDNPLSSFKGPPVGVPGTLFPGFLNGIYANFDPPIAKTSEFRCTICLELEVHRKE